MENENNEDIVVAPTGGETKEHEESFAEMLEKSSGLSERLRPGQKVRAKVVSISGDFVYIDLGGKSEGVIDLKEVLDKEGNCVVKAGDEIDACFVSVQDGVRKMTTLVNGYSAVSMSAVRSAHEAGVPVSGDVKREVKGGFEVSVGGVRCFCPFSQIDLKGGREGGIFLGRTFPFKVIEFGEEGRNVILSRRALLEQEKQAKIENLKSTLTAGMEVTVPVTSVQNFGAFVDLGGIDGMIPASELSWERTMNPMNVLSPGQQVTAKIISLDWERNRLTLSLKAMQPDPWASVPDKYQAGGRIQGKIVRLAPFGAFVNLEPGIDGLIHISNLGAGRRINHPKEVVETGQVVEAYVLSVDAQNRKISLSMQPKVEPKKVVLPSVGDAIDGVVDKVMPYGVFVKIKDGLTGLVPNSEMATASGSDHKRMFPAGSAIHAVVIEVDEAGKVRLSRKAAVEKAAQDEFDQYRDTAKNESSSGSFGSLGEILKAKLEEKKQQVG
jgi:small subunit ribosomal protein S1